MLLRSMDIIPIANAAQRTELSYKRLAGASPETRDTERSTFILRGL
jgi:hypothetical protein